VSVTKKSKHKATAAIPGVILIITAAGLLTYGASLAVAELTKPKPVVTKTIVVVKEEPKVEEPAPAPTPEPAPEPTLPTATTNSFVYLRPTASTSGTPLKDLQAGTVVQYTTRSTTAWQQVTVDGVTGYVYKRWLTF
jgi:hypothetical protein